MPSNDRDFLSGATVKLTAALRDPTSGAPVDPPQGVKLDALLMGTTPLPLPGDVDFTQVTPGQYVLSLQTEGFAAGAYTWRARATDANGDVALAEDGFVVRARTGLSPTP